MSIYIWKDNHQEGPFPESEILGRLSSGGLSGEDLAWTTGYDEWRPLSEILRLDSKPRNHPIASPVEPMEIRSAASENALTSKSFWNVLRENAITTTCLAQSQAQRKKLEWLDLRTADHRIGKKAYADGNTLADHAELVSRLIDTQINLESLRKSNDLTPTTLAEKAKAALRAAVTVAKTQALRLNKHRLLTALGARLRQTPPMVASLAPEIDAARAVSAEMNSLDAKIEELEARTFWWARRPLWIIAILLTLSLGWIGIGIFTASSNQSDIHPQAMTALQKPGMASPSGKERPAALEKVKLTDDRPTPAPKSVSPGKSAGASQEIDTALSFAGEHLWILRALFTGDVQTLYQSGDLGGVFLYIIALHNTFKDRAPALYDERTQLQLGAAYAKFGVSGHNIESVLDAFLRRPNDLLKGGAKATFDHKGAEWEGTTLIDTCGPNGFLPKGIAAGISKFAGGSMAAVEAKYQPATDGSHPANVSDEQFKSDPTAGKKEIERFSDVYKYYDAELIQGRAMGNRYAIGYTLSRTPPNAEVESIEEWFSVFRRDVLDDGEIISRGRMIPRSKVMPVPVQRGDYLDLHGDRVFAEPYYYSPPSTASAAEQSGP